MNRIFLICTVHAEKGLTTVSALSTILERMQPEVIFVELPPEAIGDYFQTCIRKNLESDALRRYRVRHLAEIVPVDLSPPDEEFFSNNRYLFETVEKNSREFCHLIDLHCWCVGERGFSYLNSKDCSDLWSRVYIEMANTLERMGDSRLIELYKLWNETINRRDNEMIENIVSFSRNAEFERAVFLVGSAHRQSITEKAIATSATGSTNVLWDFSNSGSLST